MARHVGVCRLSIGAQTFFGCTAKDAASATCIASIGEFDHPGAPCGFANLSIDLLIGMSGQTESQQIEDLQKLLILNPEHVSLYQLTVEPHTFLVQIRRGNAQPSPDQQADSYQRAIETLSRAGFRQYEISNFARALPSIRTTDRLTIGCTGRMANIGIGVSAHSFHQLPDGRGESGKRPRTVFPSAYLAESLAGEFLSISREPVAEPV